MSRKNSKGMTIESRLADHSLTYAKPARNIKFVAGLLLISIILLFPRNFINAALVKELAELPRIEFDCPPKN